MENGIQKVENWRHNNYAISVKYRFSSDRRSEAHFLPRRYAWRQNGFHNASDPVQVRE